MLSFIGRLLDSVTQSLQAESLRRLTGNPIPSWRSELFFPDEEASPMERDNTEHVTETTEFGLLLPNGQVAWGAPERPMDTMAARYALLAALAKTADECGFPQEKFLTNYNWVSRRVKTHITHLGTFAAADPEVVGTGPTDSEDHDGSSTEDLPASGYGDGGGVHSGPVGSVAPGAA